MHTTYLCDLKYTIDWLIGCYKSWVLHIMTNILFYVKY